MVNSRTVHFAAFSGSKANCSNMPRQTPLPFQRELGSNSLFLMLNVHTSISLQEREELLPLTVGDSLCRHPESVTNQSTLVQRKSDPVVSCQVRCLCRQLKRELTAVWSE